MHVIFFVCVTNKGGIQGEVSDLSPCSLGVSRVKFWRSPALLHHLYFHCLYISLKLVLMMDAFILFPGSKVDTFGVLFAFCILVIIIFCLYYFLH